MTAEVYGTGYGWYCEDCAEGDDEMSWDRANREADEHNREHHKD